jgi:hypothetical protein
MEFLLKDYAVSFHQAGNTDAYNAFHAIGFA